MAIMPQRGAADVLEVEHNEKQTYNGSSNGTFVVSRKAGDA